MKLTASAERVYGFSAPTQVIRLLQASHSSDQAIPASDQTILADELTISGDVRPAEDETASGDRRFRACLSGETREGRISTPRRSVLLAAGIKNRHPGG